MCWWWAVATLPSSSPGSSTAWARETTLLYRGELFLRGFDGSVRKHLQEELTKRGMDLQFNADIERIDKQADGSLKVTLKDGRQLEADCVFYATGRRPMLDNLGLENTGVKLDKKGFVEVDDLYQTAEPSILALGDVIGRVQLTPVALAEGMAVARRLFKPEQYRPVDYKMIPTAVFSLPNIGTVGLTEEEAREAGPRGADLRKPLPANEADPDRMPGAHADEAGGGCPGPTRCWAATWSARRPAKSSRAWPSP